MDHLYFYGGHVSSFVSNQCHSELHSGEGDRCCLQPRAAFGALESDSRTSRAGEG